MATSTSQRKPAARPVKLKRARAMTSSERAAMNRSIRSFDDALEEIGWDDEHQRWKKGREKK